MTPRKGTHVGIEIGSEDRELERLIRSGLIGCRFAPVYDIATETTAGYRVRAFNREDPDQDPDGPSPLRAAVHRSELVADVDASLRDVALRTAEAAGLPADTRLFIAAEPESLVALYDRTNEPDRSVILQLSADRVARHPAAVLRSVRSARQLGWGIGMSEVGSTIASTSFLPIVNPSVVSLHPTVLKNQDNEFLAEFIRLLNSHVERTNAVIIAHGVADEDDLERVASLGARLATGSYFGDFTESPAPVPQLKEDPLREHLVRNLQISGTPYSIAQGLHRDPLVVDLPLLGSLLRSLLQRAESGGPSTVVVGVFADEADLSPLMREAFENLRDRCGFVGMLSGGFNVPPVDGVRSGPVDSSDSLRREYAVVVVGPDWSGMVTASQRVDLGADGKIEYDTFVTTQRYPCVDAARTLLSRITVAR